MTFYLKYRSQTIENLDLTSVRETIKSLIVSGNLPHAFLFSGPKGTGKTSTARILAKVVNCENLSKDGEPCNKCKSCSAITKGTNVDVIELDAASHRGIDDVRALREAVKLAPMQGKKKIYIIDEAHMLTTEASNALLKTLEEPPDHVVFILATTNPEKLIDTIRSRTTNIEFSKATQEEVIRCLKRIMKAEKLDLNDECLNQIAQLSSGSFRDAVKILEQITLEVVDMNPEKVSAFLDKKLGSGTDEFIKHLLDRNTKSLLEFIEGFVGKGGTATSLTLSTLSITRQSLLAKIGIGEDSLQSLKKDEVLRLITLLTDSLNTTSPIEQLPLEVAVVYWCSDNKLESFESSGEIETEALDKGETPVPKAQALPKENNSYAVATRTVDPAGDKVSEDIWKNILFEIKPVNTSIEALLRAATPIGFDGKTLNLGVFYKFHKERLEDATHRRTLETIVEKVMGQPVRVICTLTEPPARKIPQNDDQKGVVLTEPANQDIIDVAKEIFGN